MTRNIIFSVMLFVFSFSFFAISQDKAKIGKSNNNFGWYQKGDVKTFYIRKAWFLNLLKADYKTHYEANNLSAGSNIFEWKERAMTLNSSGYYVCDASIHSEPMFAIFWFHSGGLFGEKEGRYLPADIQLSGNGNSFFLDELISNGTVDAGGRIYYNFRMKPAVKLPF